MAYGLCIWDAARHAPLPVDDDDARAVMERLSATADAWNPALVDFGAALMRQAEGAPATPGAPSGAAAFWGGDVQQAAIDATTAVLRLTLPGEDDDCIARIGVVVDAAAQRGLVVYDDETGMCFLPDGRIFPDELREMWVSNLADATAGPRDPSIAAPDSRTFAQKLLGELVDAIGRGNRRIY